MLIKNAAQAMPVYAMNVFLLPADIAREIEQMLAKFWWNSNQANGSKLCWMSWDRMSNHKNLGGARFSEFQRV